MKKYTDGSVLDNTQSGAVFIILAPKVEKSYYIGEHYSVFTAELVAILLALYCIT